VFILKVIVNLTNFQVAIACATRKQNQKTTCFSVVFIVKQISILIKNMFNQKEGLNQENLKTE